MVDDPKDYFCVTRTGRLIAKNNNKKAIDTINAYDLNNYDQLQKVRLELIRNIGKHLETVLILIDSNKTNDAISCYHVDERTVTQPIAQHTCYQVKFTWR
jgi:hypothetical protein